jgi:hypothetical protein
MVIFKNVLPTKSNLWSGVAVLLKAWRLAKSSNNTHEAFSSAYSPLYHVAGFRVGHFHIRLQDVARNNRHI